MTGMPRRADLPDRLRILRPAPGQIRHDYVAGRSRIVIHRSWTHNSMPKDTGREQWRGRHRLARDERRHRKDAAPSVAAARSTLGETVHTAPDSLPTNRWVTPETHRNAHQPLGLIMVLKIADIWAHLRRRGASTSRRCCRQAARSWPVARDLRTCHTANSDTQPSGRGPAIGTRPTVTPRRIRCNGSATPSRCARSRAAAVRSRTASFRFGAAVARSARYGATCRLGPERTGARRASSSVSPAARWARAGPGRCRPVDCVQLEHAGRLGDAFDLVEEAVAFDAVGGIFQRVLGEHDHEAGCDPGPLPAQDAAHPLDHLAPGPARAHHDPEVRVGYVDAFVEHPRRRDGVEPADAQVVEDLAALTASRRPGDQIDRHQRIEPVDGVVRGAHGLGEHERAVGALDRRARGCRAARTCRSSAPRSGAASRTRRGSRARRGRRRRRRARRGARPRRGSLRTARAASRAPDGGDDARSRAAAPSRCTRPARRPTAPPRRTPRRPARTRRRRWPARSRSGSRCPRSTAAAARSPRRRCVRASR